MPWIRRRRYDRYYDPYYERRGWSNPQSSCLRDACLLETGCCIAEGLDGNCLMLMIPLLPRLLFATGAGAAGAGAAGAGAAGAGAAGAGAAGAGAAGARARPSRVLLSGIRLYQREISAHRPACCRFTPSCSEYAAQAIEQRGALRGVLLAARRLVRCRPGGARGLDPVPA